VSLSEDDDYLPMSALQHLIFCERQVALIHVLGRWAENVHTTIGRILHERVDSGELTSRPGIQVLRTVPLRSARLRLRGVADVVEVHSRDGTRTFMPVEYKKGGRRRPGADDIQLAAQAMALEEMVGVRIDQAAIFMAKIKKRRVVAIDPELRGRVEVAALRLHALVAQREVPKARFDNRCAECSLRDECGPEFDVPSGALTDRLRAAFGDGVA
jgi:CRISPR-associated exonuclease Cas4